MNILNLVICTLLLIFSGLSFAAPLRQAHLRGVVTEEGVKPLIFVQALEPEAGARRGTYYRLAEPQEGVTFGVLPTDLKRGETVEFNGQFQTVQMGEEAAGQFINPMSYSTLNVVEPKPQDALTPECQTRLYEKFKEIEGLVPRSEHQEP